MRYLRTTETSMLPLEYDSQRFGATAPFLRADHMNMCQMTSYQSHPGLQNEEDSVHPAFHCHTFQQHQAASCHSPQPYACSAPFMMSSVPLGGPMDLFAHPNGSLLLDVQNRLVSSPRSSICVTQNSQFQSFEPSTTVPLSHMSTTVISSRAVKDPRLAAREKRNSMQKAPEELEQEQLTESHNSELDLMGQSGHDSWSSSHSLDKELTGSENGIKGKSKGSPESSGNLLCCSSTQHGNDLSSSPLGTKKYVEHVEIINKNSIDQWDPHLESCENWNPICCSTKDSRVTESNRPCVNTGSTVYDVPQKTPEDKCTEVQQQQILTLGTNHDLHDTIQVPVVCRHELSSDASRDVKDTDIKNCENYSNPLVMKAVGEAAKNDSKEIDITNSQESTANEINHSSPKSIAISPTETEHIPFIGGHKICRILPYEDLDSNHHMPRPTEDCTETLRSYQKSSDLDQSDLKTAKVLLFNNMTDLSKPGQNSYENTKDIKEFHSNSKKPVDTPCPTVSGDLICEGNHVQIRCPDFTHPECNGSEQHTEVKHSAYTKTTGEEALHSSGAMERKEEVSTGQILYTDFMSIGGYEEVHDKDVSEESMNCHSFPELALAEGENENVKEDSPHTESTHFEEGETEDSSCHSKCEKVTHNISKAQVVDEELSDEIYCMLYKRIQFSQLFPSQSGGNLVSDKPYLKPRSLDRQHDNSNSIFTLKSINSENLQHSTSMDEPNIEVKKLNCRSRIDQYNLRITIEAESRNICFRELQILSKKFSFTEYSNRKHDVAMLLGDDKSLTSGNISVSTSAGTDPGEVQIHEEAENGASEQDQPVSLHHACSISEPTQLDSKIRNNESNTTEQCNTSVSQSMEQCNASVSQFKSFRKNQSTVQHSVKSESSRKMLVYCRSSNGSIKKGPQTTRRETIKTSRLHHTMKQKGKFVSCSQKSMLFNSKSVGKGNKISTQDTLRRKKNVLIGQIRRETTNSARITLRSFLINRNKPFMKGANSDNTVLNNTARSGSVAINVDTSSDSSWTEINNNVVDLAPIQEVDGFTKCMALEGSIISASDTDNKPHSVEDQLQNREHPQEIPSCCNSDKDNSLLSTNCCTECMDSNQEDFTLNMKYQNEGTSKEHTYTIISRGDTAVESFTYENEDNSGLLENQQREPEAERDTAKAVEDTKSDDTQTSTKDNVLGCEYINAPVDRVSEMNCDSDCGKAGGCLALDPQVETGKDLKSTFTNGAEEAVNTVTLKETDNSSHLQEHKGNNGTPTKELRLITKLKNYLTRFESSINVQEQNNSDGFGEYRNVDTQPLITETGPRDQAVNEQQEPRSDPHVRVEFPQNNPQNGSFTSIANEENCSFLHFSTMAEEEIGKGHNQTEEMTTVLLPFLTLPRMHHGSEDLSNSRGANHTNLSSDEQQNCNRTFGATLDETVTLESGLKDSNHPGHQAHRNDSQRVHSEISAQIPDTSYFMRNPSHRSEEQQSSNNYSHETSQTEKIIVLHNPWATKPNGNTNHQSKSDPKCNTTSFHRDYSVGDISSTLKEADFAVSLNELNLVRSKCKEMLSFFISAFERDQNIDFNTAVVSRDAVMERYLKHPPAPVDLKYEALNSFLELQMMMEAVQFVENKMRFISGELTFRTLLWYDPSLKGELYKGRVGCQQQSSLYSSLHENNVYESYSRLHQYFSHIPKFPQVSSDTSHYMYLKNKREKLEIQVALQNFADLDSFFLSLPVSCIINFGDSLEDLETLQKRVISFTEVHSSQLQGPFDIGKAEHLLIMHRFISEKINYLLSCKVVDAKVSWFGLEHLQHDASKMLAWNNQKTQVPYRLPTKCNDAQRQTVIRADGAAILPLKRQSVTEAGIPTQKKRVAVKDCKSVRQGNAKKKQNCAQTKYYENVSVKKDLSSSMSRSGNIVKPSAKHVETPGSLFHIGARRGACCEKWGRKPSGLTTAVASKLEP
ncbi:hypothetical protein MATL_G00088090 [Megalops atlanticus]|uniref:Testis expressed sequence 15 domain-containing protein n=1 Tax=Megalops atlanticus TaxID=7932 RepID=A0A9D3Q347_MEGAT|nr:hypothetical protein MATL_G00088090 [Megalops atlanticus]